MCTAKFLSLLITLLLQNCSCITAVFTTTPDNVTQAEGLDAIFFCQHPAAQFIAWFVNGVYVNNNLPGRITFSSMHVNGETIHTLTIAAIPEYNGTVVRCSAILPSGTNHPTSSNVTLILQGPLDGVTNLVSISTNNSITITWVPSFSLDLTTADPDIAYCVDVFNITSGGQREMIASDCSVLQPQYIFTVDSPDLSDLFEFTVTPRSNVEGAKNGTTSDPVEGYFLGRPQPPMNIVTDVTVFEYRNEQMESTSRTLITVVTVIQPTKAYATIEPTSTKVIPNVVEEDNILMYVVIAAVLSLTSLVIVIGVSFPVVLLMAHRTKRKRKRGKRHSKEVELKKCDAYKTVVLKGQNVLMNENSAYHIHGSPVYEEINVDLNNASNEESTAPVIYERVL